MAGCEWEAEGGKELLWMAIKEGFVQKKSFWFVKMGKFCGQFVKFSAKERLLACENGNFSRTAKKGTYKRSFCAKKTALSEVRKVSANENLFDSR